MRLNRNIAASYASRLWAGLSAFVFVPLYLRLLGPEAFGLITFSTTLLGIAFIFDMGMSSAFAREMAREHDRSRLADLLRSLEIVYVVSVGFVAVATIPLSGAIAYHWLNASTLDPHLVRRCVALMLMSSMLQVMMALYLGGLLGAGRHAAAAVFQIGFGLGRSGLVLVPLFFWREVEVVFVWQFVAALIGLLLLRRVAWRDLRATETPPRFSRPALATIGGFATGMFGIALISTINTQSDKLVVSKIFSLADFGAYSIASLIGQVPSMLALPLAVTILPRLTGHVAREERALLLDAFMQYSTMIAIVAIGAASGVVAAAPELLALVRGEAPSASLVNATRLLAIGGALLATQYMPYHLAVACGHTRTNIVLGSITATILPFALWFGAQRLGIIGAAWPWLLLNAFGTVLLAARIIPAFLGAHLSEWVLKAHVAPLTSNVAVVGAGMWLWAPYTAGLTRLALVALCCLGAFTINVVLFRFFNFPPAAPGRRIAPHIAA